MTKKQTKLIFQFSRISHLLVLQLPGKIFLSPKISLTCTKLPNLTYRTILGPFYNLKAPVSSAEVGRRWLRPPTDLNRVKINWPIKFCFLSLEQRLVVQKKHYNCFPLRRNLVNKKCYNSKKKLIFLSILIADHIEPKAILTFLFAKRIPCLRSSKLGLYFHLNHQSQHIKFFHCYLMTNKVSIIK